MRVSAVRMVRNEAKESTGPTGGSDMWGKERVLKSTQNFFQVPTWRLEYLMKLRNVFHILAKDTEKHEVSRTHNLNCLVKRKSLCSNYRKGESIADNPP